jgi:hypothetical protein
MIRAIAKAVLIIGHATVARQKTDMPDGVLTELKRLADQRK